MPPILSTLPRSPDFVRRQCSSQKPYRLICACMEPASFQSFVMFSTLNIAPRYANLCCFPFHGVVPSTELAGVEEHSQYLYVVLGGAPRNDDADYKQRDPTEERMQQREDRAPGDQSDEEQPSLCSQDSQRPI